MRKAVSWDLLLSAGSGVEAQPHFLLFAGVFQQDLLLGLVFCEDSWEGGNVGLCCTASSNSRDSPSFLEWSLFVRESRAAPVVSQGRPLLKEGCPRDVLRAWFPSVPRSLPAGPAQHRLKEKMVQNPVGFWWE